MPKTMISSSDGARSARRRIGRTLVVTCLLATLGMSVSGCVVRPVGGWCFYHPFRCR